MIPKSYNAILNSFNFKSYLDHMNTSYTMEGDWIHINCPWCGDYALHLGINIENNAVNCWRCGKHNIGKLIQLMEQCSWSNALSIMERYQSYRHIEDIEPPPIITNITLPKEFRKLNKELGLDCHWADMDMAYYFLYKRGLLDDDFNPLHEVYYSGYWGVKYKFRILFPIYIHHILTTFMTRDITGRSDTPYIAQSPNEAVTPCKHTLYPYDEIQPNEIIILVEGPIDQWKLGRGSLATWGTGVSIEQVALLRTLSPKKVFILFDSEETAQIAAKKLSKMIWFCDSEVIYLDDKKDPGELSVEEGKQLMRRLIK